MMARLITLCSRLIYLGPGKDSLLSQSVNFSQESSAGFDPGRPNSLVTPVLSAPPAHLRPFRCADAIEPLGALLTASENPASVELSGRATAIGFAAFSSKEVERTRDHRLRAKEITQSCGQSRVGATDLLAQFGGLGAHSVLSHTI